MSIKRQHKTVGFSLIEIIVAIAVLLILLVLLIPISSSVRKNASRSECASRLRTVGMALRMYAADNDGMLPFAEQGPDGQKIAQPYWNSPLSLFNGLVGKYGEAGYLPHDPPKPGAHTWSETLHCPADPNRDLWATNYRYSRSYIYRQSDIASGSSGGGKAIRIGQPRSAGEVHPRWLVVDRFGSAGTTNLPYPGLSQSGNRGRHPSASLDGSSVSSYWHEGGANVLYEDGSVLWRSYPNESLGLW